jgi:hypothetical protein
LAFAEVEVNVPCHWVGASGGAKLHAFASPFSQANSPEVVLKSIALLAKAKGHLDPSSAAPNISEQQGVVSQYRRTTTNPFHCAPFVRIQRLVNQLSYQLLPVFLAKAPEFSGLQVKLHAMGEADVVPKSMQSPAMTYYPHSLHPMVHWHNRKHLQTVHHLHLRNPLRLVSSAIFSNPMSTHLLQRVHPWHHLAPR